jgi:Sigma-70 region 3
MRAAEEALTQQLGRTPDDAELARHLGVPEDDVLEARQADLAFTTYSLDAPLSGRADRGLLADVLGEDDPAVARAIDMEAVYTHLDELPQREQRVLVPVLRQPHPGPDRPPPRQLPDARIPPARQGLDLSPCPDHQPGMNNLTGRRLAAKPPNAGGHEFCSAVAMGLPDAN